VARKLVRLVLLVAVGACADATGPVVESFAATADLSTGGCRLTWQVTNGISGHAFAMITEDSLLVTRDTVVTLDAGRQLVTWEPAGPLPWAVFWDTASFGVSHGGVGSGTVHPGCTT